MPPASAAVAASPAAQQFGSFFNKPVAELLRFKNDGAGDDAAYWAYVDLPDAQAILNAIAAIMRSSTGDDATALAAAPWPVKRSGFTFVNQGAFGGAAPLLADIAAYWRQLQQTQPLCFFDRILFPFLAMSVRKVRRHLALPPARTEVLLFPNATYALNCTLRNLTAPAGRHLGIIFSTTYGSVKKMAATCFAEVIKVEVPVGVMRGWRGVSDAVAYLDAAVRDAVAKAPTGHSSSSYASATICLESISSNTAMRWPVGPLAAALRRTVRGAVGGGTPVRVMVDAAHELGMTATPPPVAAYLEEHGIDIWLTNGHKWFACPSGVGIMVYNKATMDPVLRQPVVLSHGSEAGQTLASMTLWHGHVDYAPWLALGSAVDLWEVDSSRRAHARLATLADAAVAALCKRWGTTPAYHGSLTPELLRLVPLPDAVCTAFAGRNDDLQNALHHNHRIECPVKNLDGQLYVRISVFHYNTIADYEQLGEAVMALGRAKM